MSARTEGSFVYFMEWPNVIAELLRLPYSKVSRQDEVKLIRASGLFDEDWYRERTGVSGDPIEHYVRCWKSAAVEPHPLFDTAFYLAQFTAAEAPGAYATPLAHFAERGGPAGSSPCPLFASRWYAETHGRTVRRDPIAFRDYVKRGYREGLAPHPLFDPKWYALQVPDIAAKDINPLTHFMESGAAKGINPNRFFDTKWYSSAFRSRLASQPASPNRQPNSLIHFVQNASAGGLAPAPNVDLDFYRQVASDFSGDDLQAYVRLVGSDSGLYEAALTSARHSPSTIKQFSHSNVVAEYFDSTRARARTLVVFAMHNGTEGFEPHQELLIDSFPRDRFAVVVVNSNPRHCDAFIALCKSRGLSAVVRDDHGRDFASWVVALLRLAAWIDSSEGVILLNDSVYGPISDLAPTLRRALETKADCFALTDSYEQGFHLQSYFLHLRSHLINSDGIQNFLRSYPTPYEKRDVIRFGELGLSRVIIQTGNRVEALAPYSEVIAAWLSDYRRAVDYYRQIEGGEPRPGGYAAYALDFMGSVLKKIALGEPMNPTHFFWNTLIDRFQHPFVKRELLHSNPCGIPNLQELPGMVDGNAPLMRTIIADQASGVSRSFVPSFSALVPGAPSRLGSSRFLKNSSGEQ